MGPELHPTSSDSSPAGQPCRDPADPGASASAAACATMSSAPTAAPNGASGSFSPSSTRRGDRPHIQASERGDLPYVLLLFLTFAPFSAIILTSLQPRVRLRPATTNDGAAL